jgi:hypothetical protein
LLLPMKTNFGGWITLDALARLGWPIFSGLVLEKVGSLFLLEPSAGGSLVFFSRPLHPFGIACVP